MSFCKIVITDPSQSFSHSSGGSLSYAIPEHLTSSVQLGSLVSVPLRNKKTTGLVIDIYKEPSVEDHSFELKDIDNLINDDVTLERELIELLKFTAEHYACSYSDVVSNLVPRNILKSPQQVIKLINEQQMILMQEDPILQLLAKSRQKQLKFSRLQLLSKLEKKQLQATVRKLEQRGLIKSSYVTAKAKAKLAWRNPMERIDQAGSVDLLALTVEQTEVLQQINQGLEINPNHKFLIHGVTASGKTEIYLRLIADILALNKSAILLVPEISLAPQVVERVAQRFGVDNVLIWHSALTQSEKAFTFSELQSDKPKIVVGARSAIFAPVKNLGLIVVDEEHENSYKQDQPAPRYHARTIAEKRSELNNCPLILGSATPSVETYYKALNNPDYKLLTMKQKVFNQAMPSVQIVDMRQEFNNANKSIFARPLHQAIKDALTRKEQVILFLNKRGAASHVFCRGCGFVYKCNHCESKTVYHSDRKIMICHYCGFTENHPQECPQCNSTAIKFFGLGTQKLEQETQRIFPEARVARLDSDVSRVKHGYIDIWNKFKNSEIDILIGTQMIAKGLDFPNLTVVGVIAADSNFNQLDYLADERGFQLLTQVSGRTGRADKPGLVVFQSYDPEKQALIDAKNQNYEDFYNVEIALRKDFLYPPFSSLIRFVAVGEDEVQVKKLIEAFAKELPDELKAIEAGIVGPCPAVISRISNKYRYHLLVKIPEAQKYLIPIIKALYQEFDSIKEVNFSIDIESTSFM